MVCKGDLRGFPPDRQAFYFYEFDELGLQWRLYDDKATLVPRHFIPDYFISADGEDLTTETTIVGGDYI